MLLLKNRKNPNFLKNKSHFKILLITDLFEENKLGGAEIYFYNLIKGLKKNKNICIFFIARSNSKNFIRKICNKYLCIPNSSNIFISLLLILLYLISINILMALKKFDLVLLNHPFTYFYTLLISRRKKKIIFHSPWCLEYKYRKIDKNYKIKKKETAFMLGYMIRFYIEKWVYNNIQKIITLSKYMKKICVKLFKTNMQIITIYPSIDTEEFCMNYNKNEIRKELKLPLDKLIFFTARAMIPRTGIKQLIEAIDIIKSKVQNSLFIISGDGPYLNYYKSLVVIKKLVNLVKFTGFLDRVTLIKYFYASDCFLVPSCKLEGFGLVILEALYANIPVIATPVGAIPEILSDIPDCQLSNSRTPQDFARELLKFTQRENNIKTLNLRKYFSNRFNTPEKLAKDIICC